VCCFYEKVKDFWGISGGGLWDDGRLLLLDGQQCGRRGADCDSSDEDEKGEKTINGSQLQVGDVASYDPGLFFSLGKCGSPCP
jgi:hypothetical protein